MRAAVVKDANKPLVVEEIADPSPGPDDAVLRVEASGICRSDWHGWQGDWKWIGLGLELPAILGHEFGGEVVAVGENVRNFREGDRVTAPFHHGCGRCEFCLAGRPNLCAEVFVYGFAGVKGSYAEYLLITEADTNLIQLPENVAATSAAALGCRFMTGFHAIGRGRVAPGEWVAVQGAGGVGLSAIQTAAAVGAQVIAVDIEEDKLEKAREAGATAAVNSQSEDVPQAIQEITKGGAHVGIDALGIQATISNSINSLRKGGRHVQVGLTGAEEQGIAQVPIDAITAAEIEILGSFGNPQPNYPGLLALVSQGRLDPESLIEREVGLGDINEVFDNMSEFKTKGFNIITTF
ncbi:MAG: zinc-dependent alcohol dehydrogenase family protein [Micrococcaceae bacterium]|nr:zinc-dependent alcohol dehydrogenase family protein [Micrococcaceae bacterium]